MSKTTAQTLTALANIDEGTVELALDAEFYGSIDVSQLIVPHVRIERLSEGGLRLTADGDSARHKIGESLTLLLQAALRRRR
jgi:hypothetical protein